MKGDEQRDRFLVDEMLRHVEVLASVVRRSDRGEFSYHRPPSDPARLAPGLATAGKLGVGIDALDDPGRVGAVAIHTGSASAMTCARMNQNSDRSLTTSTRRPSFSSRSCRSSI